MNSSETPTATQPVAKASSSRGTAILAVFLLTLGTSLTLGRMASVGRMSGEMGYDDVVYALSGSDRVATLVSAGLPRFLSDLWKSPPHAPVTEFVAIAATILGGPSTARIYILNALITALLLTALGLLLVGLRNWRAALVIAGVAIASPVGYFVADQFRPDPWYVVVLAMTIAAAASLFVRELRGGARPSVVLVGGLGAALLYIKPSFFVFTIICLAGLAGYFLLISLVQRESFTRTAAVVGKIALTTLAFALPFGVLLLPGEIEYIRINTVGEYASIWTIPDPLLAVRISWDQAASIAAWMLPMAWGLTAISVGYSLLIREPGRLVRGGAIYATAVISLIPVALSQQTSPFFGMVPVGLVVAGSGVLVIDVFGSAVASLPDKLDRSWKPIAATLGAIALIAIVATAAPAWYSPPVGQRGPLLLNTRLLQASLSECESNTECDSRATSLGQLPEILVAPATEVSKDSIAWLARESSWNGEVHGLPFLPDSSLLDTYVEGMDFVVVLGEGSGSTNERLPVNQIQIALTDILSSSPEWRQVAVPVVGDRYRLFSRIATTHTVTR